MYENGKRKVGYQVDVMDGEIKIGELKVEHPTVSMTSTVNSVDAEVKYSSTISTTGRIYQNGKPTDEFINWSKHRFKVWLNNDGSLEPLGVFIPQDTPKTTTSGSTLYKTTGYDTTVLAKNDCITERLALAQGTLYLDAIQSLLISAGINKIIADDSTATLQSDRDDWDIGTSKLKIANQLLSEMSFRSTDIDSNGYTLLKQYDPPSVKNIKHTYVDDEASIIEPDTEQGSNLFEIPNIWIATVSNPDLPATLVSKYVNDNPLSKTSTVYTGQNKVKTLSFDNIASQTDLDNAVSKQAFLDMQGIETIEFKTAIVSGHGTNDTVALRLPQFEGIVSETSWEIDFDSSIMTHSARKAVDYG